MNTLGAFGWKPGVHLDGDVASRPAELFGYARHCCTTKGCEMNSGGGNVTKPDSGALWNAAVSPASYTEPADKYQTAILEQYKTYVEMADRVSQRRALTNTFFLTLNTAVFTLIGVFLQNQQQAATGDGKRA